MRNAEIGLRLNLASFEVNKLNCYFACGCTVKKLDSKSLLLCAANRTTVPEPAVSVLKGQCQEIFCFVFFS
jgi:hypothetical protein